MSGNLSNVSAFEIYSFYNVMVFFSGRSSTCYVRDWAGYIVSICLILFGIVSITVINVYQEKIKDEVYGI